MTATLTAPMHAPDFLACFNQRTWLFSRPMISSSASRKRTRRVAADSEFLRRLFLSPHPRVDVTIAMGRGGIRIRLQRFQFFSACTSGRMGAIGRHGMDEML